MSWTTMNFLMFLFLYSTTGIPLNDVPKRKLSVSLIPSQWGKDSEISHHWPKGEVPYVFDDKSYDDGVKDRVRIAMAALERDSCIRFKEQKVEGGGSWLHFTNPELQRQCFHEPSYRAEGEIQVVLGYDCLRQRDIMHSVLHGVGFRDEVSHPQRDLFVKIMWGNIQSAYKSMFRIQPVESAGGLVEYDPMSIMHFHDRAYSLNGQATISPLLPGLKIEPSDKLSHLDKMKLRIMFGHECNKRKVGEVLDKCKGILTQYEESELITPKPEDATTRSNEDVTADPSGNNGDNPSENNKEDVLVDPNGVGNNDGDEDIKNNEGQEDVVDPNANGNDDGDEETANHEEKEDTIDPNATGNNDGNEEIAKNEEKEDIVDPNVTGNGDGDEEIAKHDVEEVIVVGNDARGNNNGDQNENVNALQETIIVGNDAGGNNNGDQNENVNGLEETVIVGNNDNTIETSNVGADKNLINTDNSFGNKDAKPSSEMIIVGNAKTSNNPDPEDLKGKIIYNSNVAQDVN